MSRYFGSIAQIGQVVRDIHAAMDEWLANGVGPWFVIEISDVSGPKGRTFAYNGKSSANWDGDEPIRVFG